MASQITSVSIVYSTVYSRSRSKKTSGHRVTGFCEGNSPVTGEFPAQMASNANIFPFDDVIMFVFWGFFYRYPRCCVFAYSSPSWGSSQPARCYTGIPTSTIMAATNTMVYMEVIYDDNEMLSALLALVSGIHRLISPHKGQVMWRFADVMIRKRSLHYWTFFRRTTADRWASQRTSKVELWWNFEC